MKTRKLESLKNPIVREAVDIKKRRYGHEAFIIEGPHLIESAVNAGAPISKVFFTGEFEDNGLLTRLYGKGAALFEITGAVLSRLADTETPQGIVAVCSYKAGGLSDIKQGGILVVIDGVREPGNLGAIIRTSDAVAADAVILMPGTCDAFMPKALRASAGSIFNVPIIDEERGRLIRILKEKGVRIAVTSLDAGTSVFDADLSGPIALVFGNEASGVSDELKGASDLNLKIPIMGKAESLNVASAAAVCLYEALRQAQKGS